MLVFEFFNESRLPVVLHFIKILFQNIISLIQLENDCEEEMLNQAQNCYSLLKDFLKGKWKGKPPSLQLTTPEQIESVHF